MAACTAPGVGLQGQPGQPVLTLYRPNHHLDHVQYALRYNTLLVVSEKRAKRFICYTLLTEYCQRFNTKWSILVTDACSEHCSMEIFTILDHLLPCKPLTIITNQSNHSSLPDVAANQNVLIMSSDCLINLVQSGVIETDNIALVILNFCSPMDIPTKHVSHAELLKVLAKQKFVQTRIVGLMCLDVNKVSNALDLKDQIQHIESAYRLSVHFSSDLLAMNNFGEEIKVTYLTYITVPDATHSPKVSIIFNQLKNMLQFLSDVQLSESENLVFIKKLALLLACAMDVLILFSLWSFELILADILNLLDTMKKEGCNDEITMLTTEACKSQFEYIQGVLKGSTESSLPRDSEAFSQLVYKICDVFKPFEGYCYSNLASRNANQQKNDHNTDKNMPESGLSNNKIPHTTPSEQSVKEENVQRGPTMAKSERPVFRCIVATKNNLSAKLLSKSLNYLSAFDKRYGFLKCGCIVSSNEEVTEIDNHVEKMLQALYQNAINVVVTTLNLAQDLHVARCNMMVYFGVPHTYPEFFKYKSKARGLGTKFVLVVPDKKLIEAKEIVEVFQDIEVVFESRVHDFISTSKKKLWLEHLQRENTQSSCNNDKLSDSMISSIYHVNRYCRSIFRGNFSIVHPQFTTHHTSLSEKLLEVKCSLHLPFASVVHQVHKSRRYQLNENNDVERAVATLRCKMETTQECVKLLCKCGEMDENLELADKYLVNDPEVVQNCELDDEGKGRAGTNKRRRAYDIKVPSFLQGNMPVANEPLFLYKIDMDHVKSHVTSKSRVYRHIPPEIDLGILSRKQIPKMPKFTVYTSKHDVTVTLVTSTSSPVYLDAGTLSRIRDFHEYVFRDLLRLESCTLSAQDGYLITPLHPQETPPSNEPPLPPEEIPPLPSKEPPLSPEGTPLLPPEKTQPPGKISIHYEFLSDFKGHDSVDHLSTTTAKDWSVFENMLVHRINQGVTSLKSTKYVVQEVCTHLTPFSPFPDVEVADTFADYYRTRYDLELEPDQPLLLVRYVSSHINFLFPRHNDVKNDDTSVSGTSKTTGNDVKNGVKNDLTTNVNDDVTTDVGDDVTDDVQDDVTSDVQDDVISDVKDDVIRDVKIDVKSEMKNDVTNGSTVPSSRTKIYLMPQLCSILPLSAPVWRIVSYLPTIVCRLNMFLLAEELLRRIRDETEVGCELWPDEVPLPELGAWDNVGEDRLERVVTAAPAPCHVVYKLTSSNGHQSYYKCSETTRGSADTRLQSHGVPEQKCTINVCPSSNSSDHRDGKARTRPTTSCASDDSSPQLNGELCDPSKTSDHYTVDKAPAGSRTYCGIDKTLFNLSLQDTTTINPSDDSLTKVPINAMMANGNNNLASRHPGSSVQNSDGDRWSATPLNSNHNHHHLPPQVDGADPDAVVTLPLKTKDHHASLPDNSIPNTECTTPNNLTSINHGSLILPEYHTLPPPDSTTPNSSCATINNLSRPANHGSTLSPEHHPQSTNHGSTLSPEHHTPPTNHGSTLSPEHHTPPAHHGSPLSPEHHTPPAHHGSPLSPEHHTPPTNHGSPLSPEHHTPPANHTLPSPSVGPEWGPSLTMILRAVTAKASGQFFHSERLEVLGDAFLKLASSMEVFLVESQRDEWELSVMRSFLVSNDNLSTQGRRIGLPEYMITTLPDINRNYLPPGFVDLPCSSNGARGSCQTIGHGTSELQSSTTAERSRSTGELQCNGNDEGLCHSTDTNGTTGLQLANSADVKGLESTITEESPSTDTNGTMRLQSQSTGKLGRKGLQFSTYRHQVLGDKMVANCVEALIGAYLVCAGASSAHRILVWLGVAKCTLEELHALFETKMDDASFGGENVSNDDSTSSTESSSNHSNCDSGGDLSGYWSLPVLDCTQFAEHIENEIGYRFRNPSFLQQVIIHTSYSRSLSPVPESYQRLEFLGDAVLDHLVTFYLFSMFPTLSHGDLTDFRSSLVNNFTLAFLAVKTGLHKFLRCLLPHLVEVVSEFVAFLDEQEVKQGAPWKTSICASVVGNSDVDESNLEVPKVLGDIFEALIAAVFLDCGQNLDIVWNVFYPLFQPFIDYYKDNIPRSPIRTLQETFPDQVVFSLARLTLSKKFSCNVFVIGYGNFKAVGRTPKIAKSSVARKAMQHIRNISPTVFKS